MRDERYAQWMERESASIRNTPDVRHDLHVESGPRIMYKETDRVKISNFIAGAIRSSGYLGTRFDAETAVTRKLGFRHSPNDYPTAAGKIAASPVNRQLDLQKLLHDITGGSVLTAREALLPGRVRAPAVRDTYDTSALLLRSRPVLGLRGSPKKEKRPRGIMDAFVKVCLRWELTRHEQAQLLGFPPGDPIAEELLAGGLGASSQDIRERVGYVVGISMGLNGLFGRVHEAELSWLRQARPSLDGKSPIRHMLQRRMINLVEVSELLKRERGL